MAHYTVKRPYSARNELFYFYFR